MRQLLPRQLDVTPTSTTPDPHPSVSNTMIASITVHLILHLMSSNSTPLLSKNTQTGIFLLILMITSLLKLPTVKWDRPVLLRLELNLRRLPNSSIPTTSLPTLEQFTNPTILMSRSLIFPLLMLTSPSLPQTSSLRIKRSSLSISKSGPNKSTTLTPRLSGQMLRISSALKPSNTSRVPSKLDSRRLPRIS